MTNRYPMHSLLALTLATSFLAAQQPAEGYQSTTAPMPISASSLLATNNGLVSFDGTALTHEVGALPPQILLQLPASVFGSFTIAAGAGNVLFGESSNGDLWLVPLNGLPPTQPLANLPFNYDAVLYDATHAIVSAKTTGFSTSFNDLVLVDLGNGNTQNIASLPGASGPVAIDDQGDIYYATSSLSFPPPAGGTDVLRFPRALVDQAIANNTVLGVADAQLAFAGLASAGSLAFDDDGDLLFTDFINNQVGELNDIAGGVASFAGALVDYTGASVGGASLQFVGGPGTTGVFEPFQPSHGELLILETDYFSQTQLRRMRAQRSMASSTVASPIPAGAFDIVTTDGPTNGIGVLALATSMSLGELVLTLPGYEQPLLLDAAMTSAATLFVTFDANGESTQSITNPGFAPALDIVVQIAHFSTSDALGTTPALVLQLTQ